MTGDVGSARFYAAPMLVDIRAHDLDSERTDSSASGNGVPLLSRERPWIHTISHNTTAEPKVVFGDRIADGVAFALHLPSGVTQGLFDGVDSHMHGADRSGQFARDSGLADTRESAEHNQHAAQFIQTPADQLGASTSFPLSVERARWNGPCSMPMLLRPAVKHILDLVRAEGRRSVLAVLFVATTVAAGGCETSTTTTAGPDPVKCQVSVGSTAMMDAAGGGSSFSVTTQPECAWEASTTAPWISGLSPASGQGNGTVAFRVAANEGTSPRDGSIAVNGQQVVVSQRASCRYTVTSTTQNVGANGGEGSVTVAAGGECAWTASTDVSWITLTPPVSGSGNGTVAFTVAPNTGEMRTGTITIAGQRITVTQAAETITCTGTITPTSQSVGVAGGPGVTITVSTPSTCQWTAVSNVAWIAVSASTSRGSGTVAFTVAANTGPARTGMLTIAGRVFTVTQAGVSGPPPPCAYSISAPSQNLPAPGGMGTVNVSAGVGCTWTASSGAPWITITSGASGTGNGPVAFNVAANTGAARTAMLTIAGQAFIVTQDGVAAPPPCMYSIAPASQNAGANASTGTVTVTAGAGCAWTATSNAAWLSVTSGATGTGNGSVGYSVAANTGAARAGTITIAGQTFTVTQDAAAAPPPCMYSISPNSQNFTVLGGSGMVNVTAGSGCTWTASSSAPWITITSGSSGTGNGSVMFSVAANLLGSRSGTLTIAGQVFTITQAAVVPLVRTAGHLPIVESPWKDL
jgi:Putative binding domain, N-terminal/Viral BACON domain